MQYGRFSGGASEVVPLAYMYDLNEPARAVVVTTRGDVDGDGKMTTTDPV